MNIKYIDTGKLYEGLKGVVVNNSTRISRKNGIPYIEFTPFDEFALTGSLFIFLQEMAE